MYAIPNQDIQAIDPIAITYGTTINDSAPFQTNTKIIICDDFQCKGFNTNSFIKYFGGINKGRPNAEVLECAKGFAANLKESLT